MVSLISVISTIGIALGVAVLIVGLSAMNGFERELNNRILAVVPHGEIEPVNQPWNNWNEALAKLSPEERKKIEIPQGKWQGVAQTKRSTDATKDPLRGFIDTSKLREALGYR